MEKPDNGYDQNGNKINDNGGNTTDYLYDDDENIISSTKVEISHFRGGELSSYSEG